MGLLSLDFSKAFHKVDDDYANEAFKAFKLTDDANIILSFKESHPESVRRTTSDQLNQVEQ